MIGSKHAFKPGDSRRNMKTGYNKKARSDGGPNSFSADTLAGWPMSKYSVALHSEVSRGIKMPRRATLHEIEKRCYQTFETLKQNGSVNNHFSQTGKKVQLGSGASCEPEDLPAPPDGIKKLAATFTETYDV